jgi:F-type H+-transporting ATPase subunit gamma
MAGLKAIKRRIVSVKNTRKITRAMKMVAAGRLRRAQQRIVELRPYANKTVELIAQVAARTEGDGGEECHPLLTKREERKVLIVVLTSDRGLAGGFNANINKRAFTLWRSLEAEGKQVSFGIVGRKGGDFFRRRKANVAKVFSGVFENLTSAKAGEIGRFIAGHYVAGELDAAYLIYNEFKSAMTQTVTVERVLPVTPVQLPPNAGSDYIYEPNRAALLDRLLPMYMEIQSYRALLESVASEHGARMTAMDNATRNASDMIDALTLQYNRARQAAITKELMEIIGGAEALKG